MRFYIAAPFFNQYENSVVSLIEDCVENAEHTFYSPRHDGVVDVNDPQSLREAFDRNVKMIDECDAMLAWLERDNGPGGGLYKVIRYSDVPDEVGEEVFFPDTGTVWEIGYAYSHRTKPIIGYVRTVSKVKVNTMLTQTMAGVVHGVGQLEELLVTPVYDWGRILEDFSKGFDHDES